MKSYSIEHIINISKTAITYQNELREQKTILFKQCSQLWYQQYGSHFSKVDNRGWRKFHILPKFLREKSIFTTIGRMRNRYIGDRFWNIGGESVITFYAKENIQFVLETPSNPSSIEYRLTREKWNAILMQIQDCGWWLMDCN